MAMPSARATNALHRARILGLGLSVGIAIALGGCRDQKWPKADDVYHRQIVLPPADGMWSGLHYTDPKTGKNSPEVCDTYGSGVTVCSEASFDKAPPIKQYRAEIAAWEKRKKAK